MYFPYDPDVPDDSPADDGEWLPLKCFLTPDLNPSKSIGSVEELFGGLWSLPKFAFVLAAICPLTRGVIEEFSPSAEIGQEVVSAALRNFGPESENVLDQGAPRVGQRLRTAREVARIVHAANIRPHLQFALVWRLDGEAAVQLEHSAGFYPGRVAMELAHALAHALAHGDHRPWRTHGRIGERR